MAYAMLAGMPPHTGIWAALLPLIVFSLFTTSRFASLGPVALVALLVAEGIGSASASIDSRFSNEEIALVFAAQVGLLLFALGLLRLGFLVNFISDPVLVGFTSAAGVLIAVTQLDQLIGLEFDRGGLVDSLRALVDQIHQSNPVAAGLGVTLLIVFLLSKKILTPIIQKKEEWPSLLRSALPNLVPFLGLVAAISLTFVFGWKKEADLAVVGNADPGLPPISLPPWDATLWRKVFPHAAPIAALVFVIGLATARALAGRRRQSIEPDREAIALGLGNAAASISGGFPVGVSLSRSALSSEAGSSSSLSQITTAAFLLVIAFAFSPLLAYLPEAALAALIISAVVSLIDVSSMRRIWRYSWQEGLLMTATFLGVLFLGIQSGILIGALSGLGLYLWRTSRPRVVFEAGVESDENQFRSVERDETSEDSLPPNLLVMRIEQDLYFGNASLYEQKIHSILHEQKNLQVVILDFRSVDQVDYSAIQMLSRLVENADQNGLTLHLAEVKKPVVALIRDHPGSKPFESLAIFLTTVEAIEKTREILHDSGIVDASDIESE